MQMASEIGLDVPETIITNDPNELIKFSEKCGGWVALRVVRSRIFDSGKSSYGIYTNKVFTSELVRLRDSIRCAPVMAQKYIEKKFELRITIIAHHVLACAIHSQDSERTMNDWGVTILKE